MERLILAVKKLIPRAVFRALQRPYHFSLALTAALFYFLPSRKLKVIGVTGTDGKSSVVELLHEILRGAGVNVASVSSLRFKTNEKEEPNMLKMTMPGRFFLQRFMKQAVKSGREYVILEVTSEGARQFRHKFIKFDAAVLTNVTPEHIEAHGSFEKYRKAKAKLFASLGKNGVAILNRDEPSWGFFAGHTKAKINFYSENYLVIAGREYPVSNMSYQNEIRFRVNGVDFSSLLFGRFNVSNILAALTTAHSLGIPLQKISEALKNIRGIPGRLEIIQREPFRVVVDYAHTPNALRNVYETLRSASSKFQVLSSKLICVLGAAGGGRDKWKRPELGKIAAEFCGEIIVTNEDPYDENPRSILDDIERGFSQIPNSPDGKAIEDPRQSRDKFQIPKLRKTLDRREAIREALQSTRPGDTVIITGKGAEQWIMGPGGIKIPWDDRGVVREELEKI